MNDYTMRELRDELNKISHSNLRASEYNDRITITKKYFSDFFPFNFYHICSCYIHAKSVVIESESENLVFEIELRTSLKFSLYSAFFILGPFMILALLSAEWTIGFVLLIGITISVLWAQAIYSIGIANFTKNWDEHIGTMVCAHVVQQ